MLLPPVFFEHIDALPGSQGHSAAHDRNRKLHLREGRAQMRRHVVRSFIIVRVTCRVFRRKLRKERFKIRAHFGGRVFLDQQRRSRCDGRRQSQGADVHGLRLQPLMYVPGDLQQPAPSRPDAQYRRCLAHRLGPLFLCLGCCPFGQLVVCIGEFKKSLAAPGPR